MPPLLRNIGICAIYPLKMPLVRYTVTLIIKKKHPIT